MNSLLEQYSIHYKGLKLGKHHFSFEVDELFFEDYEEGEINKGNVYVSVELEKHQSMLEFRISITGTVEVICDRCLEPFMLPIVFKGDLFVKTAEGFRENDYDVWYVDSNDYQVNLAQYIYESICLSVPIKRYHGLSGTNKSDCDPLMLKRLGIIKGKLYTEPAFDEVDPRWEKLKSLRVE